MEAAIASGILKIVGDKLAPLLIKEYSSIVGAKKDLQELHGQIMDINNWFERIGDIAVGNDPSFNWLKDLKNIAYDVDDIVDELQLKAEKHEATGGGGIMSKYLCTKPKSIIFQCKAASKIKAIKKEFAAILKTRNDFSTIKNSFPGGYSVPHMNKTVGEMPLLPNIDAASVVGRDKVKHELISELVEVKDQQIMNIVSIIGLGGSGKTTLAKLVFNDGNIIDKNFEPKLWVHVSQEFEVVKLVGKLFEAIVREKSEQYPLQEMSKTISDKLTGKRYLLVLDDVWTTNQILWDQFMVHLKSGTPGSAILLTMRHSDVAETVRSTYQFSLPFLSLDDSWQLFQQSLGMHVKYLEESEFVKVGEEILQKCGGVPLAIKAIAGVLHGKELIEEWQAIRDNNLLDVEGEEASVSVSRCLRLSYFHLPSHMKQCFTICSVFPKGYMIDKEQLIGQWIAHDMITPQAGVEFLDIGERYFNSLVQMSFLQDVAEDWYGRVKCRMHDLVHDLALSILDDKISLTVPKEATSSTKSCRYFSLIERSENMTPKNTFRKARAIYMPWSGDYTDVMALKHAKHLRSVMVGYLDEEGANIISQIKYLKYLSMTLRSCKTLPECISNIWSLQVLHVRSSWSLVEIPESIGKLRKLRTLNLSGCNQLKHLPESIGDCEMISSIELCSCTRLIVLPNSIGKLQKLRRLNLSGCTELKRLPNTIGECKMISSIALRSCSKLIMLPNSIGKLQKLRTLHLSGCRELKCLPDSIGRNEKLRVLRLGSTKIERLPSTITTLRNLECLDLEHCVELVELPEGISNLDKLQVLNLNYCKKLGGMPVGIGQLSRLEKLGLFVIGKEEKFARISELANVSWLGEELRIIGIQHVMDANDAHMICLKQKTNLQSLELNWTSNKMEEVNTKLQQDVLDGLEPPPVIEILGISGYSGRQCAGWMQSQVGGGVQGPSPFPFLRVMRLYDLPGLQHLDGLVELPCLQQLSLIKMPYLESISGGPFPSLVQLDLCGLPRLGEVWLVPERVMPNYNLTHHMGEVQVGSCLTELDISGCPKLEVMPHLPPSLQRMSLAGSEQVLQSPGQCQGSSSFPSFNKLKKLELQIVTGLKSGHGWELLQQMKALESLGIRGFSGVQTEVPESLWSLTSLRSLEVSYWMYTLELPESLGELRFLQELTIKKCDSLTSLPQTMGQLTSLRLLEISGCGALQQLPDCLGELCSLRRLEISDLRELTCLPQSICRLTASLRELDIDGCPGLTSLPQGMEGLASLEMLTIRYCSGLTSLPQGIEALTSLKELSISNCPGLTSLPQGIKGLVCLEKLDISRCPEIKSLPDGIKGLTALKKLRIYDCPDLERRCKRGKGKDWHLISHIPDVSFD